MAQEAKRRPGGAVRPGAVTKPGLDKAGAFKARSKKPHTPGGAGAAGAKANRRHSEAPGSSAVAPTHPKPPHPKANLKAAPPQDAPAPPITSEPPGHDSQLAVGEGEELPSSRLCVKNLPKYMTDAVLKKVFSAKGEVTDVKIMRTSDGQSRQLGFVGFKSDQEASAARKYFDNTYVDAMRITVEFARSYKDPSLARPWSKHSTGSSAHARTTTTTPAAAEDVDGSQAEAQALAKRLKARQQQGGGKKGPLDELTAADPRLAEFLALMAPRSRAKLWANDELAPQQTLKDLMAAQDGEGPSSDDEEYQDLPGTTEAGAGGAGGKGKKAATGGAYGRLSTGGAAGAGVDEEEDEEEEEDGEGSEGEGGEGEEGEGGGQGQGGGGKDQMVVSEVVSDLEYLRSRMRKWSDNDDDDLDLNPTAAMDADAPSATGPEAAAAAAAAAAGAAGGEEQQALPAPPPLPAGGVAAATWQAACAPILDPEGAVRQTSRLFLRNLGYGVTEAELLELAGRHGDVTSVHLVIERESKKSKGIAYVQYVMPDDAVKAYKALDGTIFQGRLLHVLPAKAPPSGVLGVEEGLTLSGFTSTTAGAGGQEGEERSAAGSSFKAVKEERRKADAGNRAAWNSLFMRPDTVQEAVAAHYGVTKSELMDARTSGDLAVRVALGEAAIIQQTKAALTEQGVNVACMEQAAAAGGSAAAGRANVARSPTALLVKNLPFSTTEDALLELFSRSGPVSRVVLPPSHALALVEYCEPQDARSAFKALAYKKFQHVPLYLEWAPRDIFTTPPPSQPLMAAPAPAAGAAAAAAGAGKGAGEGATGAQGKQGAEAEAGGKQGKKQGAAGAEAEQTGTTANQGQGTAAGVDGGVQGGVGGDEEEEGERTCCIYVKNLAFSSTDASMKKHFDKVVSEAGGVLHSARVSRRKHPSSGELLSAGYGFVEVDSPEVAAAVITKLQNSLLDHHKLSLQLSKRKPDTAATATTAAGTKRTAAGTAAAGAPTAAAGGAGGAAPATKLVVRNVAFEATRKDLVGLFSPFGHLKSCRLPKKFDGAHRGFAFVEFVTKQEARNAVEGVTGTHLYGRRLVVEYAKEEGGLDELRAKTGDKYRGEDEQQVLGTTGHQSKRLKRTL